MMCLAILIKNTVDDVRVMDAPIGKAYLIESQPVQMEWHNPKFTKKNVDCVLDLENGGYIPLELLKIIGPVIPNEGKAS